MRMQWSKKSFRLSVLGLHKPNLAASICANSTAENCFQIDRAVLKIIIGQKRMILTKLIYQAAGRPKKTCRSRKFQETTCHSGYGPIGLFRFCNLSLGFGWKGYMPLPRNTERSREPQNCTIFLAYFSKYGDERSGILSPYGRCFSFRHSFGYFFWVRNKKRRYLERHPSYH